MGRKPALTEYEKGQIDALRSNKETLRTIAASLGRSTNVVHAYLRNPDGYGMKKSPGRKLKLWPRDVRCIINATISGDLSAAAIANSVSPQVSKRTVQRLLQRAPHLVYMKMKPTPNSGSATTRHDLNGPNRSSRIALTGTGSSFQTRIGSRWTDQMVASIIGTISGLKQGHFIAVKVEGVASWSGAVSAQKG